MSELPPTADIRGLVSAKNWLAVSAFACGIAVLALGAHDLAISHLGIPYPDETDVPEWAKYLGQVVRLTAMVWVCRLASWRLDRMKILAAALSFGLLVVLLQETIRVIIVDNVVSDGWIDRRWIYLLMTRLPSALVSFYNGAAALIIARMFPARPGWALPLATLIVAAAGSFALLPALKDAAAWIDLALHLSQPPEVHQPPYVFYVYRFIYGTFIEPTIACFVLVYLVWPRLTGSTTRRIVEFAALMLLMRGRVVATALFSVWIRAPLPIAIAAEGQFFAETLVMATLTAVVWARLSTPMRPHSVYGSQQRLEITIG